MEEYNYLDEFLEKKVIDRFMIYREHPIIYNDVFIEKSIELNELERLNLSDEEFEYAMNYLKQRVIYVVGASPALYSSFDNYVCKLKFIGTRIDKNEVLSDEKQNELLEKYKQTHDVSYRNQLVESYMKLVVRLANIYSNLSGIDSCELESYGYETLIHATENYNCKKGKFITFANKYIKLSILNGIRDIYGIKSTAAYTEFLKARKNVIDNHDGEIGYDESDCFGEIINNMESVQKTYDSKYKDFRMVNLLYPLSLDDVADNKACADENSLYNEVIESMYQEQLKDEMSKMLECLSPTQKLVIIKRFGLDGNAPSTLKEISELCNVTAQAVSLMQIKALKKIKKKYSEKLENFSEFSRHEYDFDPKGIYPSDDKINKLKRK